MAIAIAVVLILIVGGVGALAIWRMEASRRRVIDGDIEGVVIEKRHTPERAEGTLPARGVGPGGVRIVPESFVLAIETRADVRQLVVDEATFNAYTVGDSYPHSKGQP